MMDIDLDLEEVDPIKHFLNEKLKEIQLVNENLEKSLQNRLRLYQKTSKKSKQSPITIAWKKIINNKYILGLKVLNKGESFMENVIINWDSKTPIDYTVSLIHSYILIAIPLPLFIDQLTYAINGVVIYEDETFDIPPIELSASDLSDKSLSLQIYKMIEGSPEEFYSCRAANEIHEFLMILPTIWTRSLDSLFEIECCLNRIDFNGGCFYVAHKISPVFDGTIVEAEQNNDTILIKIYSKDQNATLALLHYFYRLTNNIQILENNFIRTNGDFKSALIAEVQLMKRLHNNNNTNSNELTLVDLQCRTDLMLKNNRGEGLEHSFN